MHPTKTARGRLLWGVIVLGALSAGPAFGQEGVAPQPREVPPPKVDSTGALIVPLQGSIRLQMKTKALIQDVFNEREDVVTIAPDPTDPTRVILIGRSVGISRVTLTDVDKRSETYEVVVQPDIELLRNLIRRAVPTANLEIIPGAGNTVILAGNVAHAGDVEVILGIARSIIRGEGGVVNAMSVGGVQQVQLDVVVAQVNRTEARNYGFSFGVLGSTFRVFSILGGLAVPGAGAGAGAGATGSIPGVGGLAPAPNSNIVFGVVPAQFAGFLQALRAEGLAKLLAEPRLVTQSGRPARFLAGGRQAVLGPASGINGPGVIYEDIGTELQFLPIVYGDGKIYLEVAPTIRSVNQALGIVTTFGAVPGFDEQSVRTSVVMEDGQTFAIGGLIQSQVQASSTRVPFLGDVPFVGAAFRTNSQTETEQELVILVTPHLVDPMDCHQVSTKLPGRETRSPSDFELFLEGLMEAPRGQREIFEGGRYKAAYKNHPSYQQYPCNVLGGVNGHGDGACAPAAGHTVPANLPFPAGGAAFPPAAPAGAGTGAAPGLPGELPPAGEPLPPAAGGEAGLAFPDGPPVMPAGTRSIP